jgi:hypothetical protein
MLKSSLVGSDDGWPAAWISDVPFEGHPHVPANRDRLSIQRGRLVDPALHRFHGVVGKYLRAHDGNYRYVADMPVGIYLVLQLHETFDVCSCRGKKFPWPPWQWLLDTNRASRIGASYLARQCVNRWQLFVRANRRTGQSDATHQTQ